MLAMISADSRSDASARAALARSCSLSVVTAPWRAVVRNACSAPPSLIRRQA